LGFPSKSIMAPMNKNNYYIDAAERRIMFHAVNSTGLGHLSRLIAIALAIRERAPYTNLLFTVDGASHGLLEAAKIPFIALPYLQDVHTLPMWSVEQKDQLVFSMANSITQIMCPELLIFDCFTNDVLLRVAQGKGIPLVICMRKMKNMDKLY